VEDLDYVDLDAEEEQKKEEELDKLPLKNRH
jgi:hypothetical protein